MLCFVLINSVILNFLCAWILFHASCCHWCSHLCCSFIFNQEPDMRPNFAELQRQLSELNREGDYPHIEWLWFTPLLPFTLGDEVLGMSSTQKTPSHQNAALTSLAPLPPPAPPQPPPPPSSRPSHFTPPAPLPPLPSPHPEACVWCCGHFLHRLSRQPGGVICHERSSDLLFEAVVGSYLCRVSATAKISSPLCGLSALTDWLG